MFKSIRILIAGIVLLLVGIYSFNQGETADGVLWSAIGCLCIISYLPGWEIGRVNVTILAQAVLCGFLAGYCVLNILNGSPDLHFNRRLTSYEIPYGNYLAALIFSALSVIGILGAFGIIRRD